MQPDLLDSRFTSIPNPFPAHALYDQRCRADLHRQRAARAGRFPAMVIEAEEAEQFAALADALLINVGTLTAPRAQSMRRAIESAVAAGTPGFWIRLRLARWRSAPVLPANIIP